MKKIIRLTESDLMRIIKDSVKRAINEDVLGNYWNANPENKDVRNNYEPFDDNMNGEESHDWSGQGEEGTDPTFYDNSSDIYGFNRE